MKIENNKILEATTEELYEYWLPRWSDLYSFSDYKNQLISLGVKIIENKEST